MRKRYFDWEYVFEYIWQHCDKDGIWNGDDASVAAGFDVPEDEAHEILDELCQRHLIENVYPATYAIVRWRDRDDPGRYELC
jgi:hypothetical protein